MPVSPAAHYVMGGILTSLWGETNLEGFYACGEAACTGAHGANRLASNSLLEGLVFASRVAEHLGKNLREFPKRLSINPNRGNHVNSRSFKPGKITELREKLRRLMFSKAGIIRSAEDLQEVKYFLKKEGPPEAWLPGDRPSWELKNMFLVAELIAEGALVRKESRGSHYRQDYPFPDPAWSCRICQSKHGLKKAPA